MNELMNGVQVLSERAVNIGDTLTTGIIFLGLAFLCLIITIIAIIYNESFGNIFVLVTFVFGLFGAILIIDNNPQHYIEYKVTINDNITYKEFTDKFEVISQEGEIYTVKLKVRNKMNDREKEVYKIANNALYFNDNSDYETALYEILKVLNPELEDYPILKYIE